MRRAAQMLEAGEGEEMPTAVAISSARGSESAPEATSEAARRSGTHDEVRKYLIRRIDPSHESAFGGVVVRFDRAQPATTVKPPPAAQKRGKRAAPGWRGTDAPNPHAGVSDKYWAQASALRSKELAGETPRVESALIRRRARAAVQLFLTF